MAKKLILDDAVTDHDAATGNEHLRLRRKPLQRRGQVTFNRVLDAAEQILVEKGVLELTTNLIASRSGVNIS